MSRANAMSALGRMGWGTHALIYPTLAGLYIGAWKPHTKRKEEAALAEEFANISAAKPVDPDHFNPFSPIPFANNPELKYVFANVNMRHFTNENHLNEKDYMWRNYFNSYDHGNKKTYIWNWSSV